MLSQMGRLENQCLAELLFLGKHIKKQGNTGARGLWQNQHFQQQRTMDFSTPAVFCEHRYFETGHEMPWGRGPKHTFNGICKGFCAPSFSKLYFFEKNCFYRQFFSSVANSWNKSLSTLFLLHTYLYAWLNSCGLGRPSMRVFTRPQMKPLHHVHSLSICCVPATLLCPRFFFPRILRVNSERQCLTCLTHEET